MGARWLGSEPVGAADSTDLAAIRGACPRERGAWARRWAELRAPLGVFAATVAFGLAWGVFESWAGSGERPYPAGAPDPGERSAIHVSEPLQDPAPAIEDVALPMASVWLLDGFNVLHAGLLGDERDGLEWWRAPQRARLIERAERFGGAGDEVWVVFDGNRPPPGEPEAARVRAVFAASADDWLLERVRQAPEPERLAVVTRDRRLADRARHRGAHVVDPMRFLAACPEREA